MIQKIVTLFAAIVIFLICTDIFAQEITVGVVLGYTGAEANSAVMIDRGIDLAVDDINAISPDGADSIKIKIIKFDNSQKLENTIEKFEKIKKQGVKFVIGPQFSNNALAIADFVDNNEIVTILPYATNVELTENRKYLFRVCFNDEKQGRSLAKFLESEFKSFNYASIVNLSNSYSVGLEKSFSANLKSDKKIAAYSYVDGINDFSGFLEEVKNNQPNIVFIPGYNFDSFSILEALYSNGFTGIVLGGDGWGDTNTFEKIVSLSEGFNGRIYAATHWTDTNSSEPNKKFINLYKKKYGQLPIAGGALGYDSVWVLYKAMLELRKNKKEITPENVRSALYELDVFEGATGKIVFKGKNEPDKPVVVVRLSKEKFVYVNKY